MHWYIYFSHPVQLTPIQNVLSRQVDTWQFILLCTKSSFTVSLIVAKRLPLHRQPSDWDIKSFPVHLRRLEVYVKYVHTWTSKEWVKTYKGKYF